MSRFSRKLAPENIFIFGLKAEEVRVAKRTAHRLRRDDDNVAELRTIIDIIAGNFFSSGKPGLFQPIVDSLLDGGHQCRELESQAHLERSAHWMIFH